MDWDKLRVFHAVAEAGSFTHAGEHLSLSQSAVSRQISSLEVNLKVSLFHRHARGLELTEQGEMLYRTAHDVFSKVAFAEAMLQDSMSKPSGELRVTTTVGFGTTWLTPRIRTFIDMYPDIRVRILVSDDELDLRMREADVAIRMRAPTQVDLIQRKLTTVHFHIYAAHEYLTVHGRPDCLADLAKHRLVAYGEGAPTPIANVNWLLKELQRTMPQVMPALQVNNIYGVLRAVENGVGIAALPDYLTLNNARLVQILPEVVAPTFDTYFVYPAELRESKRVALFRDFLVRQVADWHF